MRTELNLPAARRRAFGLSIAALLLADCASQAPQAEAPAQVAQAAAGVSGSSQPQPAPASVGTTGQAGAAPRQVSQPSTPAAGSGGMPTAAVAGRAAAGMSAAGVGAAGVGAAGVGAAGTTTASAGQPAAGRGSDGPAPQTDCAPVEWKNPGMVPNPKLTPIDETAGKGKIFGAAVGIAEHHYVQQEFLFAGTSPAYTSRMVVHKPEDPAKFSGTVLLEWMNVSGGYDYAVDWAFARDYFLREGHVVVSVTAQKVGADYLKDFDKDRYAAIQHPGDDRAANTIFSQAAMAVRAQSEQLLGRCMPVHAVLAMGQSQSALMLTTYVDSVQAKDRVFDGFFLHAGGEPASSNPAAPVLVAYTMTEGNGSRADGPNLVKWNVAGATHADDYIGKRGAAEIGAATGSMSKCQSPMNDYPAFRVYNAGFDWLIRWVRKGEKPPAGHPFGTRGGNLETDERGNVVGGVRLPDMDVPIAKYTASNSAADPTDFFSVLICTLGGSTVAFPAQQLKQLYPTHQDYVDKYTKAADKAVTDGYLLDADRREMIEAAKNAKVPE